MLLMQGSKKPSINMVVLGILDMEESLRNLRDDEETSLTLDPENSGFQRDLAGELLRCVRGRMRPFTEVELLASLLDPEMKNISQIKAEFVGEDISQFLFRSIQEHVPDTLFEDGDLQIVAHHPPKKQRSSLIEKYSSSATLTDRLLDEVNRYLALPVKLVETGDQYHEDRVLRWWRENAESFSTVTKLALVVLSIPATSAEPERRFSSAANMLRQRRCSMNPLTMTKALFIHDNTSVLARK